MLQQFIHNYFGFHKKKVSEIFLDIELFNQYLKQNGQVVDEWYFNNIFNTKYWLYLNNYTWLRAAEQEYFYQGILTLVLFIGYQDLEGKAKLKKQDLKRIQHSLNTFSCHSEKGKQLHRNVLEAFRLVEKRQSGQFNSETNKEIYKSITWTLKNIILEDRKEINQR